MREDNVIKLDRGRASLTAAAWWPEYVQTYLPRAGAQTRKDYEGIWKKQIAPVIGEKKLDEIEPRELQALLNSMAGLSSSYVHKVSFLLAGLFRTAEENGLIRQSPFRGIVVPAAASGSRRALTASERSLFLEAAPLCGLAGDFYLFMYHTGLRPSEVARVHGEDYVRIEHLLKVRGEKTPAAVRLVPVPDALEIPKKTGPLFLTKRGSLPSKTCRQKWWRAVQEKMAEISGEPCAADLTAYCLRHDYCTRLSEAGVPLETASRIMGHASLQITAKIYQHANRPELVGALSKINRSEPDYSEVTPAFSAIKKAPEPFSPEALPVFGGSSGTRTLGTLIKSQVGAIELEVGGVRIRIELKE